MLHIAGSYLGRAGRVLLGLFMGPPSPHSPPPMPDIEPDPCQIMRDYAAKFEAPPHAVIQDAIQYFHINREYEPARSDYITEFGWSVPSAEVIKLIRYHSSDLLEIGAGNGLWSLLLQRAGVDIVATDVTQNGWGREFPTYVQWQPVLPMNAAEAFFTFGKGRDILLVWPPMDSPYPEQIGQDMEIGRLLMFVGEERGGQMASDGFFDLMDTCFDLVIKEPMPHWHDGSDSLFIWRKREHFIA